MTAKTRLLNTLLVSIENEPFEAQNLDCVAHLMSINHYVLNQVPDVVIEWAKRFGKGKNTRFGKYFASKVK